VLNEQAAKGFNRYRVPAEMRVDGATANMTPRILGVVDDAGYEPAAYIRADALAAWMKTGAQSANPIGSNGVDVLMSPNSEAIERVLRLKLAANGTRFFGDREPFLRDVTFPWQAGVAGVIAGLVAGILGGLIPALRAARIPIATVMRA
jgi:hypothetical protein